MQYTKDTGCGVFVDTAQRHIADKPADFFTGIALQPFFDARNIGGYQLAVLDVEFALGFVVGNHVAKGAVGHGLRIDKGHGADPAGVVAN